MPASAPAISRKTEKILKKLASRIRAHRKNEGISLRSTAEAAGLSRVTLYRVEKGEASVTMGAYLSVILALGLELEIHGKDESQPGKKKPGRREKILLARYPQLKKLAWQLAEEKEITPEEALEIYERNWRHVDLNSMDTEERNLIIDLLHTFGRKRLFV